MTDALGAVTSTTYTPVGNVATITDALGGVKNYQYDLLGRLVKETDELGRITEYSYDALNRVLSVKNPLGHCDSFTYDALGRITSVTDKNGNVTKYFYDANGNIIKTVDALNNSSYFEYDSMNRIVKVTLNRIDSRHNVNEAQITLYQYDKRGLVTREINAANDSMIYIYDGNGNLVQKTDADGYVTEYSYDPRNLINAINYANEENDGDNGNNNSNIPIETLSATTSMSGNNVTITIKAGAAIVATTIVPFAKNTTLEYDVDGYTVEVVYNGGGVKSTRVISGKPSNSGGNNGNEDNTKGKEVQFAYNKNGELIAMMDWNGTVNFTLDLLDRIISVNDQNEKVTSYTYDAVSNQTSIIYPDDTIANYTYDLLHRLTNLNDAESQNTVYHYDAASQLISMSYPNGWDDSYTYDAAGQLLRQYTTDPSNELNKAIEWLYSYDPQGNILTEYRDGELKKLGLDSSMHGMERYNLTHTYDALNRITGTTGLWGYKEHTYEYDSLGNLLYEKNANGTNKGNEYWYNNLNQQIKKVTDDKDTYSYSFDNRGNLIKGVYNKKIGDPSKDEIKEQYIYDATNRMVKGINEKGEQSHYIYNGLGYLVSNEWIIEKNAYGYHGIGITLDPSEQVNGVVVCDRHSHVTGQGHINPTGKGHTSGGTTGGIEPKIDNKKFAVVHKDYVLDYTKSLQNVIMESESGDNALTYRYTYGLQKDSVVIYDIPNGVGSVEQNHAYSDGTLKNVAKLYYHQDRLGSTDYLTDNVDGKVTSYVSYDDWGGLTAKAIVRLGVRELDLVQEYTGHSYDQVLSLYYAKARMYDAQDSRFVATDLAGSNIVIPVSFNRYVYVWDNPVFFIDLNGLTPSMVDGNITVTDGDITKTISNIYLEGNIVYVDFFKALEAYGINGILRNPKGSFSKPGNSYLSASFNFDTDTNKASYSVWYHSTEKRGESAFCRLSAGSGSYAYYQYLVPFEYFQRFMCALQINKTVRINIELNDAFRYMTMYLNGTLADGFLLDEAIKSAAQNGAIKSVNNFDWSKTTTVSNKEVSGLDYTQFDTEILAWTNYWNDRKAYSHSNGFVQVDPNVVKSILLIESTFGIATRQNGQRDVMQSLFPGDPTLWLASGLDPTGKGHSPNRFGNQQSGTFVDVYMANGILNDASMYQDTNFTTNSPNERNNMGFGTGLGLIRNVISTTGGGVGGNEYLVDYREVTTRMSIAVGVGVLAYKSNIYGKRGGAIAYNAVGNIDYGRELDAAMTTLGATW